MRKLVIVLYCVVILGGCSHNGKDDKIEDINPTTFNTLESDTITPLPTVIIEKKENISIPDILIDQMTELLANQDITLPQNYTLYNYGIGDLNQDGQDDAVVEIEQERGITIYIFLQDNGKYELKSSNNSLLSDYTEDGVLYDTGLTISEGQLIISKNIYYDVDQWGYDYNFTFPDGQILLNEVDITHIYDDVYEGTTDIYDLSKGTKEIWTYSHSEDESGNPYDDLLIYSGKLKDVGVMDFSDANSWYKSNFTVEPDYPMPKLFYQYGSNDYAEVMKHDSDEMLDMIQMKYFPDMKKVDIPYTKEILDNYRLLLGYDIPKYYYSDGLHELYYSDYNYNKNENRYEHNIQYNSITNIYNENKVYSICDDTGIEE